MPVRRIELLSEGYKSTVIPLYYTGKLFRRTLVGLEPTSSLSSSELPFEGGTTAKGWLPTIQLRANSVHLKSFNNVKELIFIIYTILENMSTYFFTFLVGAVGFEPTLYEF